MAEPFRLHTRRLQLRWLEHRDAAFILQLTNDPQWLRFIGDKQVNDLESARAYLDSGPRTMYRKLGFGLNRVALRRDDTPIGICGLLQRDNLPDCDLGFALLPEYRNKGFAHEAAAAVLRHGFEQLGKVRILAIVNGDNDKSIDLLNRLGFSRESEILAEPNRSPVDLYAIER